MHFISIARDFLYHRGCKTRKDQPPTLTTNMYTPLDRRRREIRLVAILPGKWSKTVHCTLSIASLNDAPAYEALSYTWGDANDTVPICVNGQPFNATRCLWHALRRLRCTKKRRVVWIDALCINQANDEEKSWQVASMGDIYRLCQEAVLFLGESEACMDDVTSEVPPTCESARKAFEIIGMFAPLKPPGCVGSLPCYERTPESTLVISEEYKSHVAALDVLCKSRWWSRIWVVQEALLPANSRFMYAQGHCPLPIFEKALRRYEIHELGTCSQCRFAAIPAFAVLRELSYPFQRSHAYDERLKLQFTRLCQRTAGMKASNPRDRVYGVLGLVQDWGRSGPLIPDYGASVQQCLTISFSKMAELDLTAVLQGRRTLYELQGLPSWLPDWLVSPLDGQSLAEYQQTSASTIRHSSLTPFTNGSHLIHNNMLIVEGLRIDRLEKVGPYSNLLSPTDYHNLICQWMSMVGISRSSSFDDRQLPINEFWRSVTQSVWPGLPGFWGSAEPKDSQALTQAHSQGFVERPLPEDIQLDVLMRLCWNKRMFVTKEGRLGMAYQAAATQDDVFIVLGCKLPLLLRRTGQQVILDGYNHPLSTFTVIGDCYIDGVMRDEYFEENCGNWRDRVEKIALA